MISLGGIGLATARAFLAANIRGLLLVDQSQERLDRVFLELSSDEQQRCQCFVADVSSETNNYAKHALELWGKLDVAVLNAGICNEPASILDTDAEIWDKIMQVNGRGGAFHDSPAVSPHSGRALLQYFSGSSSAEKS
jgi:NAD(P)-dependent dehydrogenase (short-subunit alcohol dehydrogenase family)